MTGFARPELLASTEWLADELSRPDVRIVDVRWRPDGTSGALFDGGHIPAVTHPDLVIAAARRLVEPARPREALDQPERPLRTAV